MLAVRDSSEFSTDQLLAVKPGTVSICIPARDSGELAGRTVAEVSRLVAAGLVDQVVVVDGSTGPETAAHASAEGAEVFREGELLPEFGPVLGKGDAMWRSLSVLTGDYVCFADSDLYGFEASHVVGLLGPLFEDPECVFVKAAYERPLIVGGHELPNQGGRVTELTAKPLLEALAPHAAVFRQPLAGEVAARRDLFSSLEFSTGYAVEVGMIMDLLERYPATRLAEVNLGTRRNPNQPLEQLSEMAHEVAAGVLGRIPGLDRINRSGVVNRPAMADVLALDAGAP